MRPKVILKVALSLDGYLDDSSDSRRIFSSKEDIASVDVLRSRVDAILIGAETLRKDNPSLAVKDENLISKRIAEGKSEQPLGVVLSTGGEFNTSLKFFQKNNLIITESNNAQLEDVLGELYEKGVKTLLVEGGASIHAQFFSKKLFDEMRVCIAPILLGDKGGVFLNISELESSGLKMTACENLEGCAVHFYKLFRDLE